MIAYTLRTLCTPVLALAESPGFGGTEGPDLSRYLVVCMVMLLSIAALAFGFKRLVLKGLKAKASGRSLQILDVLPLGGKQRLCVVRCYDRTFALGLAEQSVSLISELDPVIGEGTPSEAPSRADSAAFKAILETALPAKPEGERSEHGQLRPGRPRRARALGEGVLA